MFLAAISLIWAAIAIGEVYSWLLIVALILLVMLPYNANIIVFLIWGGFAVAKVDVTGDGLILYCILAVLSAYWTSP